MRPRRDAAAAYIQLKKGIIFCQRVTLLVIRERRLYRDILIYLRYTFKNSIYCVYSGRRIQQIRSRKKTLKNRPALQVTTYNSPLLPVSTLERYYFSIAWHPVSLVRDRKKEGQRTKEGHKTMTTKEGHKTMISNDAKFITNGVQDPGLKNEYALFGNYRTCLSIQNLLLVLN